MTINITGREAFTGIGPSGISLFRLLFELAQDIRDGDCQRVGGELLGLIDTALEKVVEKRGVIGSTDNHIEKMDDLINQLIERNRELLSEDEDVEITEAVMNLNLMQNAYQASLAACARVIMPSLLDYLR